MNTLNIAVIGVGGIAQRFHLPSLRRLANEKAPIRLSAVCDLDEAKAAHVAAEYGFDRYFTDYDRMLDAVAPDAVWVLVPIPATRRVAGDMLQAGIPTFLEKPPGANSRETRELIEIAARDDVPNQVAFNRRHAPALLHMKARLAEVGAIHATSCQFYRVRRTEAFFGYGTGLHGLDALRYIGGSEVREVCCHTGSRGSAMVTLVHDSGALGTMEMLPQVGLSSERYTAHAGDRTVTVDGVIGWLTRHPGFMRLYDAGELVEHIDYAENPQPPEVLSGFYGESAHFITRLVEGTRPAPDLATSLRSVLIAEAVNRGESITFED